MTDTEWLGVIFAQMSLLAIGGVSSVLPEMQRQVVDVHHWMSAREFSALFALAQAAPGPNMLVVTLVGWQVAGLHGAAAATLGLLGPSSLLTYLTLRAWHRFRERPWRRDVQAGLVPVTVGLVMAASLHLAAATTTGLVAAGITAAVVFGMLRTRLHPLLLLAGGALLGLLGLV